MRRVKADDITIVGTTYKGALVVGHCYEDIKGLKHDINCTYSYNETYKDISLLLAVKDVSLITNISSDHIQMFKEIISLYEEGK